MSSEAEQNKTLVHRFFEARVKLDLDALDKMLADDFVSHTRVLPGQQLDREGYKRMSLEFAAAFSNSRFIVEEQVAEAEKVVSRFTVHATHDLGEFLGVAPTGRQTTYNAIFIHRIQRVAMILTHANHSFVYACRASPSKRFCVADCEAGQLHCKPLYLGARSPRSGARERSAKH